VPQYNLDLDEIQSMGGADNFPIGKHRAKLANVEERESNSSGHPTLYWEWEGADEASQGGTIRSFSSLQDHALGSLKMHCEAFGLHGSVVLDTDELIGKHAMLVVGMRKRRDNSLDEEERLSVISVQPDEPPARSSNGPAAPASGVRRLGGGGASKPSARPSGPRRPREDDELPF